MKLKKLPLYWKSVKYALTHPAEIHHEIYRKLHDSKIVQRELFSLSDPKQSVTLSNYASRDGNVSSFELLALCHLIASSQPKTLLELGTFDGNTTLQMALNAPPSSLIHTLDLPSSQTEAPIDLEDLKYVQDEHKHLRKFMNTSVEKKIHQHFGDSTTYDYQLFGTPDFVFIDASHSYACVKSDTENVLRILSPGGMVLWHDFTPTVLRSADEGPSTLSARPPEAAGAAH